jgi:predicted DNA-binding protein
MANQRDKNKKALGVYVEREDHRRLTKLAAQKNTTIADLIRAQVERLVSHVELTPDELSKIKKEQSEFIAHRSKKVGRTRSFSTRLQKFKEQLGGKPKA